MSLLGIWLQVQILLAVSLVVFRLAMAVAERVGVRPSFAVSVRAAQLLVVVCFISPIAVAFVPSPAPFEGPVAAAAGDGPVSGEVVAPLSFMNVPGVSGVASASAARARETVAPWMASLRVPALALLAVGALLFMLRQAFALRNLGAAIERSANIRRIRRVRIAASDSLAVPFSVFLRRTAFVVLPVSVVERARDAKAALAHEIEHHRRRDTHWARAVEIVSALCWPNPAMHGWKRTIVELQELACDAAVLRRGSITTHDYGACLSHVAEAALRNRRGIAGGAPCMAEGSSRSFLSRRIQMLDDRRPRSRLAVLVAAALSSFAVAGAAHATRALAGSSPREHSSIAVASASYDPRIEAIAHEALTAALARSKAKAGFVVVSEPATGRLLAVSSIDTRTTPTWSLSTPITPASAMKPILAAAAIQRGVTTFDSVHDCERGKYTTGGKVFRDWKSFDRLSTSEMVVSSSSICGIKVAEKLGAERLHAALVELGFGAGASGDLPSIALGSSTTDGFHATALELVQAFGAFANGGKLMAPIRWDAADSEVRVVREVLSPEIAAGMRGVLARAVTEGTGSNAKSTRWTTAGKTSSSAPGAGALAGFIGHAPAANPRVVIYAGILEPEGAVHGNGQAAPVFREVAEATLAHLGIAPDRR